MIPTVSVLLKCFNHERYVAQAIDSVLRQSWPDFELLIADDGSTDKSPEIISSYQDERIRFERSARNRGVSITMNSLAERATGEFLAILNSDDIAMPSRLEQQVKFLRENADVAAVFSVPLFIGEDGEPVNGIDMFELPFTHPRPSRQEWLRHFFFSGNRLCAPSAMIRREAYLRIGGDDPRLTNLHDFDRWVRFLEHNEISVIPDGLTKFRIRRDLENSSARRADVLLRCEIESFQVLKRYRQFSADFLREIFADDLSSHRINSDGPAMEWLAELAVTGRQPGHQLFAVDTLHEAAANEDNYARLRELTGTLNPFGIYLHKDPQVMLISDRGDFSECPQLVVPRVPCCFNDDTEDLVFAVDTVHHTNSCLEMRGWIFSKAGRFDRIAMHVDSFAVDLELCERRDVANEFPQYPHAVESGFAVRVPSSSFSQIVVETEIEGRESVRSITLLEPCV